MKEDIETDLFELVEELVQIKNEDDEKANSHSYYKNNLSLCKDGQFKREVIEVDGFIYGNGVIGNQDRLLAIHFGRYELEILDVKIMPQDYVKDIEVKLAEFEVKRLEAMKRDIENEIEKNKQIVAKHKKIV